MGSFLGPTEQQITTMKAALNKVGVNEEYSERIANFFRNNHTKSEKEANFVTQAPAMAAFASRHTTANKTDTQIRTLFELTGKGIHGKLDNVEKLAYDTIIHDKNIKVEFLRFGVLGDNERKVANAAMDEINHVCEKQEVKKMYAKDDQSSKDLGHLKPQLASVKMPTSDKIIG